MCGIAGIFHPRRPRDPARLSGAVHAMLATLRFRGPDHTGAWADEHYAAGSARLVITGGEREGNQPLLDEHGGVFVFNGELYQPQDIARRIGTSYQPEQSDGVTLAALLRHAGPDGLRDLSAMFALALYDPRERSLLLARDAYGQKPLYYATLPDGTFAFASTLAALHVVAGPFPVRPAAIDEYLLFKSVGGHASGFAGVQQLAPGTWMRIDGQGAITRGAWNRLPDPSRVAAPAPDELESCLLEAIHKRLCTRFRPTVFLSGGLDSSIVAAGMHRLLPPEARPLALSIGYDLDGPEDETGYARRLAQELGMEHHIVRLPAADVPALIAECAAHVEDPLADPIAIPYYAICRVAADHTRVVLTGDGSDEFWAGYERFDQPPDTIAAYLPRAMVFQPHELGLESFPASYLESIDIDPHLEPLDRILRVEIRNRLRNYHLSRIDKLSMAHALEVRSPFLDLALTHLALETPARHKRDGQRVKLPLLDASRGLLPAWLLERRKQPFTGPILGWLKSSLTPQVRALAGDAHPDIAARVDVARLLDQFADPARQAALATRVWSLLVLDIWLRAVAPRFAQPAKENLDAT